MYLKSITINSFRCIQSLTVAFHKGVNIIIGENNTGKTSVMDALRLCWGFGQERRELYFQREDFHIDINGEQSDIAEFHLTFSDLSKKEQGIFIEMLSTPSGGDPDLQFHIRYKYDKDKERIRPQYWGGDKEGQDVPSEVLELLYFTYLGALRDATRDLAPGKGNRTSQLFLKLVSTDADRKKYSDDMNDGVKTAPGWRDLLNEGRSRISAHLDKVALKDEQRNIEIDFFESSFRKIVENLNIFIPVPKNNIDIPNGTEEAGTNESVIFNLSQNGLGYNNLIYTATVLGDLLERRNREPESYIALLIEEPEAHLHPQWQNVLFSYLQEIESNGIQVFITSHSPTITAKTNLDSIIVFSKTNHCIDSTSLRELDIIDQHKKYLHRFLDVTKCQLFFAKSLILVEGISETLMMPTFAEIVGDAYKLEKNAIEVVNINGVAFEPFACLFNNEDQAKRINIRCSIVTDDDRSDGNVSSRATKALELKGGMVDVFLAQRTFEYELYLCNEEFIKASYSELHPQTDLNFAGEIADRASLFVEKLNSNRDKAVFSQYMASKLEEDAERRAQFTIPEYIVNAIKWAVNIDGANAN